MFALTESTRRRPVGLWIVHYLAAVLLPQLVAGGAGPSFWLNEARSSSLAVRNQALRNQESLDYFLLMVVAISLGCIAYRIHPASAHIARKVFIFPVCVLGIALCWEIFANGLSDTVNGYLITLPQAPVFDEPWDGFVAFTFPAVTSLGYALGCRLCQRLSARIASEPGRSAATGGTLEQ